MRVLFLCVGLALTVCVAGDALACCRDKVAKVRTIERIRSTSAIMIAPVPASRSLSIQINRDVVAPAPVPIRIQPVQPAIQVPLQSSPSQVLPIAVLPVAVERRGLLERIFGPRRDVTKVTVTDRQRR